MDIILYQKEENYERVHVSYNPITEHTCIGKYYVNTEKARQKSEENYQKNKKEVLKKQKKYAQTKKGKEGKSKANEKYNHSEKGKEVMRKGVKKYSHSEKGRLTANRVKAKRKRNLGFIPMFSNPFADNEEIDYHHITDVYVIAIPRDLHQLYYGKNHRENTMKIVKQIYLGDSDD